MMKTLISSRIVVVLSSLLLYGFSGPTPVTFKSAAPDLATGKPLSIRGLLAKPDGAGPFPDDRHSSYLRRGTPQLRHVWPAFFVKQEYVSPTADSCGSREAANCPNDFTRTTAADPLRPYKVIAADAPGALAYLHKLSIVKNKKVAVAGFSLGGIVIHMTILPDYAKVKPSHAFNAAISLYGNCADQYTLPMAKLPYAPLPFVAIIGQKEERILRNCQTHLPRGPNTKLHVLPGAYHAFDISFFRTLRHGFRGTPMLYSETATENARKIVSGFLGKHLRK
jgi:dienelactone hydrolase